MKYLFPTILTAALASTALFSEPVAAQNDHAAGHAGHSHSAKDGEGAKIGKPGDAEKVTRTIQVTMNDNMRFAPASISVKRGEVIRFNVVNAGKLKHEMVIGSMAELQEHAKMMQKFPEMEHAEPNQVTVAPGKTGVIVWQFDASGSIDFACLQPGHFEAGMKGIVQVQGK